MVTLAVAAAVLVVAAVILRSRLGPIQSSQRESGFAAIEQLANVQPLTIHSANAMLARAPSAKAAIDSLAFQSQKTPIPQGNEAHWPNSVRRQTSYERNSSDLFSGVRCNLGTRFCVRPAASETWRECGFTLWSAFAQMQDSAITDQEAKELNLILDGTAPYSDLKYKDLIEKNKLALETMARGTSILNCDWGVDYQLGPDAPVDYIRKSLALGRLNVLYSFHLLINHDSDGAVRTLVAGLRFSHDVANGGTLFAAASARVSSWLISGRCSSPSRWTGCLRHSA